MNGTTAFTRLAFFDQDTDGIARWFEQRHNLSDLNAADALLDPDADGLDNLDEYLNLTDPSLADTDGDGLNDFAEVNTWNTSPLIPDSDSDGLNDYAEVITHSSDPLDADSDNDGYSDLDEVLYGGDPNDSSDLPQPLTSFTQTFEGAPNLAAWLTPETSAAPWALSNAQARAGVRSFKSGSVANSQTSSVKFRGVFAAGTLSFWARLDAGSCCNRMYVFVDGQQVAYIYGDVWTQYSAAISPGIREIEWRFERDTYSGQPTDAAYIDDVVFAP
jgi:hypothetical protein